MPQILIEDLNSSPSDKLAGGGSSFDNLVEATYEMAKKILPFLARRKIPLTPENYRIFYDYFLLLKPDLSKKIDELLESNCRFSPEISEEILRDYYQSDDDQVANVERFSERIAKVSEALNKNLGQTLDNTSSFRDFLTNTVNQISLSVMEDSSLKYLVDNILEETLSTLSSQNDLASHLAKTRQLVSSLTTELKDQARLANVDELTQLYNRRFFINSLNRFITPEGVNQLLSMVILDLDRFKTINDTWGHNIGDKVLIFCAKIIKSAAGEKHMAVRYGGEEFVLLCPGLESAGAKAVAETIRGQVESTQVTIRGAAIPVTISGGVSQYRSGDTVEEFIGRADKALYQAKADGRNQIKEG
ncbi:MAG: GGDEF domain-containing protein [Deltaproteobacteria bacterium]|jgi:diguanylate cyclase|nr:GGDEF domain-containing protein [Deltaproteobacteria bacterium]